MLLPQRLDAGDKVAVVAIASPAQSLRDIHDALELISSSNLSVHIPERRLMWSANKTQYLAGPDWVRVSELNKALSDPTVRAIVCLRGGYGSMRVLRAVNYRSVAADPKPVVGFSDITALLTALYQMWIGHISWACLDYDQATCIRGGQSLRPHVRQRCVRQDLGG